MNVTKLCTRCNLKKPVSEFRMRYYKRGVGSKLLTYPNNTCRKCDSEISNKNYFAHKDDPGFLEQWRKKSNDYYHKNKERCKEKMKERRQTPEYKEYRRKYIASKKEKIYQQEAICKRKYSKKQVDNLTDEYIIRRLIDQEAATREILIAHPEIIAAKRLQILLIRQTKTKNHGN